MVLKQHYQRQVVGQAIQCIRKYNVVYILIIELRSMNKRLHSMRVIGKHMKFQYDDI